MGFLDKAKDLAKQAETSLNSATSNINTGQQSKVADVWIKELGQWVYAERMGRDPRAAAEIEVRISQIQQWEQQNGTQVPLPFASPGTEVGAAPDPAPAPSAAPVPPAMPPAPGMAPPPPPAPPVPPAPPANLPGPPPNLPGPPPNLPGPPV